MSNKEGQEEEKERRYLEDVRKLLEAKEKEIESIEKPPVLDYLIDNRSIFFSGLVVFALFTIGGVIHTISHEFRITSKILFIIALSISFLTSFSVAYFRRDYHPIYRLGCIVSSILSLYFILLITLLQL